MFSPKKKRKKIQKILSPQEIQASLLSMISFIEQEGREKSDGINARTEEEFQIIKSNAIQEGRQKLNSEFNEKERKLRTKFFTQSAVLVNNYRLAMIDYKQEIIEQLKEEVRVQILQDMKCSSRYGNILQMLIIEGLFKLMDNPVYITCRELDEEIVMAIIPTAAAAYKSATHKSIDMKIDKEKHLPKTCLGGVEMGLKGNKIMVLNTLDARLDQVVEHCIPPINQCIFGVKSKAHK